MAGRKVEKLKSKEDFNNMTLVRQTEYVNKIIKRINSQIAYAEKKGFLEAFPEIGGKIESLSLVERRRAENAGGDVLKRYEAKVLKKFESIVLIGGGKGVSTAAYSERKALKSGLEALTGEEFEWSDLNKIVRSKTVQETIDKIAERSEWYQTMKEGADRKYWDYGPMEDMPIEKLREKLRKALEDDGKSEGEIDAILDKSEEAGKNLLEDVRKTPRTKEVRTLARSFSEWNG